YWGVEAVNGALITQSTPVSHSYFTSSVDLSADFNLDGQVDFFDYLDFANAFSAEDPSADFNGDGQVDFFDYLDFANAYGANC
ncbi:MAG: GC-type dockerin domain-anchored protein, partial [Planctomycetota bacterium]|nr:GC-type dockerin domain-anchored protein [Planctomycetota bacterium]